MKIVITAIVFFATVVVAPSTSIIVDAAGCQFILGFQTLHDLVSADVGDCLDNQVYAANGDAQQHTTKGLMVWRKADNWTAFTNGYRTWINGPHGLVERLNTHRFSWETDANSQAAVPPGANAVPPISVRQPQPYDLVELPVAVSGIGTGFEGQFVARLRDGTGNEIVRQSIHAGGTGVWGNFSVTLKPSVAPTTAEGTIEVFEPSPKGDGTEIHKAVVPITFGPVLLSPYHGFALHTVAASDTLGTIAQHWYGDPTAANRLLVANRDRVSASGVVTPGQMLRVPQ